MTYPGPGGDPFGSPAANPFEQPGQPGPMPPGFTTPPPPAPPQTNVLATLSIIFAFILAPVGAILGHIALTQPQQHQRSRAIAGITLSYTFIATALVATLVWTLQDHPAEAAATAPSVTTTSATPITSTPATTTTTTTTTPPPPPPTVAPADLGSLALSLDEVRAIVNRPDLTTGDVHTELVPDDTYALYDPPECREAVGSTRNRFFTDNGYRGIYSRTDSDSANFDQVSQGATAFPDAAAAQRFVSQVPEQWRLCAGRQVTEIGNGGGRAELTIGNPEQDGNVTTLRNAVSLGRGPRVDMVLAIAAKSNVVVGARVFISNPADEAATIVRKILDRIPS